MGKSYNALTSNKYSDIRESKAIAEEAWSAALDEAIEEGPWLDFDKVLFKKAARKEEAERKRLETIRRKQENKKVYEEDMKKAG